MQLHYKYRITILEFKGNNEWGIMILKKRKQNNLNKLFVRKTGISTQAVM